MMSSIFCGTDKFDLQRSSATKIKSKVVGVFFFFFFFGVQYIYSYTCQSFLKIVFFYETWYSFLSVLDLT